MFGPQLDSGKALNLSVAAHISAASPGGPRYDTALSREQRSSIENGIWLCQNCAKLIDNDPPRYTTDLLTGWKRKAEEEALRQIGRLGTRGSTSTARYASSSRRRFICSALRSRCPFFVSLSRAMYFLFGYRYW